jgi:histidine triad (HIT) family protein
MACLFCQIASGEISATVVHKADGVTAFRDIAPQAPTHVLIVPDRHIDGAASMAAGDEALVGKLIHVAAEIARAEGIAERGYRLVINQGRDAGQTVDHLHLHLLGGGPLHTPLV